MTARIANWITSFDKQYEGMMKTIDEDLEKAQQAKVAGGANVQVTTTTTTVTTGASIDSTSTSHVLASQSPTAVIPPQQDPQIAPAIVTAAPTTTADAQFAAAPATTPAVSAAPHVAVAAPHEAAFAGAPVSE
jgi:hypothetical protein